MPNSVKSNDKSGELRVLRFSYVLDSNRDGIAGRGRGDIVGIHFAKLIWLVRDDEGLESGFLSFILAVPHGLQDPSSTGP